VPQVCPHSRIVTTCCVHCVGVTCQGTSVWHSFVIKWVTVDLGYNVMNGTEYFVSLKTSVVITEKCDVMVNSEELIGTTEYLTLYTGSHIKQCRYNWVQLYFVLHHSYTFQFENKPSSGQL
jgi:hypothetical protein